MQDKLKIITVTTGNFEVKDLKYNQRDNIIVGLVKDTEYGNPLLRDGWICVQWTRQGKPLKLNKGRIELNLSI